MGTELTTAKPAHRGEWRDNQKRLKSQIAQLDTRKAARRAAELIAILETASKKIDRFGWDNMDPALKDQLCNDWCDVLSQYTLAEVRDGVKALFREKRGNLRAINEFQVEAQIGKAHKHELACLPPPPEPPPEKKEEGEPLTDAQRAEMNENLDYFLRRSTSKPQSAGQTRRYIEAAQRMAEEENAK